jgi:hypothetical protein
VSSALISDAEVQVRAVFQQEERLLAEAVACEEEAAAARIPHREGEHAAQALDHALAPVLPRAQQHLGVGVALERVPVALELAAQLAEVVDLAVERERQSRRLVPHRLRRSYGIDDRQAPVAEQHARALASRELAAAVAIGPAMRDRVQHALHVGRRKAVAAAYDRPGDSAHGYCPRTAAERWLGAALRERSAPGTPACAATVPPASAS